MRVPLSLFSSSPSLVVFQAEARRIDIRGEETREQRNTTAANTQSRGAKRTSSSLVRFIIIIVVIIIIIIIITAVQYFMWIKYLLFLLTDCIFFDFFEVKTPSTKKKSRSTRVRVSHTTRAHSRASAPTAKTNYPNNRSSEQEEDLSVCVLFSHARVCIYNSTF